MKKVFGVFVLTIFLFILGGCTDEQANNSDKDFVINEIDFYMENNIQLEAMFSAGLPDVEKKNSYLKSDFINYDLKDTKNVDVEYDEYYEAFNSLFLVKYALREMNYFAYGTCFNNIIDNEKLCIDYQNEVLEIDYYEYISDLDIFIYHRYDLSKKDDIVHMIKYTRIYDSEKEEEILAKKFEVYGKEIFLIQEYYPETDSFVYEYTNYVTQEFFMYKGVLNEELEFIRQTVEFYIPGYKAFVSYDMKEDLLEDYRVKLFDQGHRVVKLDVNVKSNNPTVNEITWNLLSIDGWDSVDEYSNIYYIYQGSFQTLDDYIISVQLDGYGKVNAYKIFEGDLVNEDLTLENYSLQSGYDMSDIELARLFFTQNYQERINDFGFEVNDPDNHLIVYHNIYVYQSDFEAYIARFK